jgi:hypothetical protein
LSEKRGSERSDFFKIYSQRQKSPQQSVPKVKNVPNAMDESLRRKKEGGRGVEPNYGNASILYVPTWPFVPHKIISRLGKINLELETEYLRDNNIFKYSKCFSYYSDWLG